MRKIDILIEDQVEFEMWNNIYGLARTLLALSLFCTLIFNNIYVLYKPMIGTEESNCVSCNLGNSFSLFCLFNLTLAKVIALFILSLVIIGIYPRYTAILHAWVSVSFMITCPLVDGGDQAATILSILIIPIAITDPRNSHWVDKNIYNLQNPSQWIKIKRLIANSGYLMIRFQVFFIYFEACVGKFKSPEWSNGTAIYYWFTHPTFGLNENVIKVVMPFLSNSFFIVFLTWGTLIFEGILFMGLFINKKHRKTIFTLGVLFHLGIFLIHGLPTFCMTMCAALMLYLLDVTKPFSLDKYLSFNKILS